MGFLFGVMRCSGNSDDGAQLCEYTKFQGIGHLKTVTFIVCELYLN